MSKLDIIKSLLKKRNIKEQYAQGAKELVKTVAPKAPKILPKEVIQVGKGFDQSVDDVLRKIFTPSKSEIDTAAEWLAKNRKVLNPDQIKHFETNLSKQTVTDDMRKLFAPQIKPAPAKPAPDQKPFKEPVKPKVKPSVQPETKPLVKPEVQPQTKPLVVPETKPLVVPQTKPLVVPETKPLVAPETKPLVAPQTKVQPQVQTKTQVVPQTKTSTKIEPPPPKTPTGTKPPPVVPPKIPFGFGGRARGRDLRTNITGTGVREEYISEQDERFKKFKVIYIINGSEKTNVYRYKGKDTFAKARVMRQLRERGAGSIRFMQYESFDSDIFEHEIVRGEDGRYYDDEGNSSSSISKSARRYMVGDNYHPKKNYGYGYKDNGRRKALPRSTEKIYHAVSFQQKDAAKEEGMRWDPDVKKWYHSSPERSANSKFKKLDEAYMPDATRKPVVYRAPPKRGEVVGKMKVRLIRRHQDVMPGERTATSDNTKRLRKLIRKVLKKGKLKR